MDQFNEQLVRPENVTGYKIANIAYKVLLALAILYAVIFLPIYSIICGIAGGALFYFKRYLYVEYEYVFTNGEVDIDVIYQRVNRKKKVQFSIKDAALFAPCDSQQYKDFNGKPSKVINVVPKGNTGKVYSIIINEGANKMEVRMVPEQKFLDASYMYNPRAVIKN